MTKTVFLLQNTIAMQRKQNCTIHGPNRYQVQQYKTQLHSLELEHKYLIKCIEQKQRLYRRAYENLESKHNRVSPKPWAWAPDRPVVPIGLTCQARTDSRRSGHTSVPAETFVNCKLNVSDLQSLESHSQNLGLSNSVKSGPSFCLKWQEPSPWVALTFADIKQRHVEMIYTKQPFKKWHQLLLSTVL